MLAVDTETHLITPWCLVPRLVCTSLAWRGDAPPWLGGDGVLIDPSRDLDIGAALLDYGATARLAPEILASDLVGANLPYDLAVLARVAPVLLPSVFAALAEGRHADVQVRQRLIDLALDRRGAHSLADLTRTHLGEARGEHLAAQKGPDAWRLRYAELDGVPLGEWPEAAVAYPLEDARNTLAVYEAQCTVGADVTGYPLRVGDRIVSEERELRAAWALHLQAAWGVRADPVAVEEAIAQWETEIAAGVTAGQAGGWVRPNGTTNKKALQSILTLAFEGNPPLTAPTTTFPHGQVKTSRETLLAAGKLPGAPSELAAYARSLGAAKAHSVWADPLRRAAKGACTYRVRHLLETGRASIAAPPWQQPPRKGAVRECVVPRPGYLLCSVDYDTAELCALAQLHLWMGLDGTMAAAINAGEDLHLLTATEILRGRGDDVEYPELREEYRAGGARAREARQIAKVANFGFPGGLGPRRFVEYAHAQDVEIDEDAASRVREAWFRAWPAMEGYFEAINRLIGHRESFVAQHPVSGRLRGGTGYTDGCNGFFQGLVADGAKHAAWMLAEECYVGVGVLRGTRPILFLHDEIIAEIPEDRASEAGDAMARVMREALQSHIPDVTIRAEPALMRRWAKNAKTVRDNDGRLVVPPREVR